jgi:anti-sigma regulatory factor (Ser/Thr protein kinase)
MTAAPSLHRFELDNSISEIARVSGWLTGLLTDLGASDETAHAVHLCVIEAVTNIVSYAFPPDSAHKIRITLDADAERIVVVLADDGVPFDPLARPAAKPATDLASAEIGGLGITLMRAFSSALRYDRDGMTNRLEMAFPRSASGDTDSGDQEGRQQ